MKKKNENFEEEEKKHGGMMWVPTEMDSNFGEDTYETEEEGEEKKILIAISGPF